MTRDFDQSSLSELEGEYEFEMDDSEFEYEDEYEADEELEFEADEEFEAFESENSEYAERFYELSQMEFESELESDQEVDRLINEMADNFWGGAFKKLKRKFKKLAPGLIKFGLNQIPAVRGLKAFSGIAKGILDGNLSGIAKGLLSASPVGGVAGPAMQALGLEASQYADDNREAWDTFVGVSREAYENLADSMNESAADPEVANKLATGALSNAVKSVAQQTGRSLRGFVRQIPGGRAIERGISQAGRSIAYGQRGTAGTGRRRWDDIRVRLRPGQRLIVTRAKRQR
ncbi:MAG: hypothetical protein WBD22_10430 [Pyrinomonadaceae bacterium]